MKFDNRKQAVKDAMLLYAVTDRAWVGARTLYEQVEECLKGGATIVQIREKGLNHEDFVAEAKEIVKLCHRYGVMCIINDDVQACLESGADGVHVGQDDMEAGDVRALLGEDKIIGVPLTMSKKRCSRKSAVPIIWVSVRFMRRAPSPKQSR